MQALPDRVETSRLVLRTWTDDDLDPLAGVFAEEAVWRHPLGRGLTRDETERFLRRQQQSWDQNGFGLWAAAMRDSGDLIGFVGLAIPEFLPEVLPAVEVGWRLHPRCWGQGLATEGGREALRGAFLSLAVDRVLSIAEPENEASIAVMRKLGMTIERTTVHPEHGSSLVVYQATRDGWTALAPQS